jgi:hypothetical protein
MNLKSDPSLSDKSMKVVSAKPASLVDNCWDDDTGERVNIKQRLDFDNNGRCGEIYPAYPTPRHVAGAPLANNIISCELKPVSPADYLVEFTDLELRELQRVFSGGVCDWTKPDTHGARHQGTWLSFGPSPVNRIQ